MTLDEGENITCTITNDDAEATITLIKDPTNDDGGDALPDDFDLTVGGVLVTSGVPHPVETDVTYAISETIVDGYFFVSITGDPECPSVLGGEVTLGQGEEITCTITNDDIAPKITLIKNVINDDGGTAGPDDFGISVGGVVVSSGVPFTVEANTAYAINETVLEGYTFIEITGDAKCPVVLGGEVTLNEGEYIICTITNDDLPPSTDSYVFLPVLMKPIE
jgi:hypothetical protein